MTLPAADAAEGVDHFVGRKVGAYEVVRRIGQGGMGVVYEARHDKLEQRAAIKFLHQELSRDEKLLQRFFNEARAISMSRHASIVTIYDFGQLEDSTAFILMEYLEGESLLTRMERRRLARNPLGLHMVVELGRQVAAAMALIHSKSIIHRDLKPENIFVIPDPVAPMGERVKLLDFGIVKFLEGPVRKTTVGMILGTPLYMSPEQCEGAEDLDARVDVYSLGVMLYEMLSGHLPFIADTAAALMRQHMFKEPPPLRDEVTDLPRELDTLIIQMLAKKATDRPTMEEVQEVLEALLPTVATPGRPVTGARRGASARSRPSQPDAVVPDPFAATIGGPPTAAAGGKLPGSPSGAALAMTPREGLSGVPGAPLSATGSGPFITGSNGRVFVSSASQSGLVTVPLSRPGLSPSEASRTDAVIALARRPVSLFITLALLLVFFIIGWRMLAQKAATEQRQKPPAAPGDPPPSPSPPSPRAVPAPPPAPPPPTPVAPAADGHEHGNGQSDVKHHGKKHKKAAEGPGKAEGGGNERGRTGG